MGSAMALYAAYAFYRTFRRVAIPADERADFQTIPFARVQTPASFSLDPRAEASLEAAEDEHDLEDTGRSGPKSDKQAA